MQAHRHPRPAKATPGSSAEVVIYQDSDGVTVAPAPNTASPYHWITVAMKLSQDVTLIHKWGPTPTTIDANLVIINGASQTGETVATANGFFQRSIRLQPGRNRISVVAGGTPPTATVIAYELNDYPGLIQ